MTSHDQHSSTAPTVHLLCGLPASGKSTLARQLAEERPAVRFTLDEWMLRLTGLQYDHPEYGPKASDCRELIWDTACQVLASGTDVVLDWSQWSRARRAEWADRANAAGCHVVLHVIQVHPDVAIEQAAARRDEHAHQIGAAGIRHMVELLEPPDADEGIELIPHDRR